MPICVFYSGSRLQTSLLKGAKPMDVPVMQATGLEL